MTPEQIIQARHVEMQDGVVGGRGGMVSCSCGARWSDADLPCPALEDELFELHHARLDDDGAPPTFTVARRYPDWAPTYGGAA